MPFPIEYARDDAIEIVTKVLPRHVETIHFQKMPEKLPEEARAFWKGGIV